MSGDVSDSDSDDDCSDSDDSVSDDDSGDGDADDPKLASRNYKVLQLVGVKEFLIIIKSRTNL